MIEITNEADISKLGFRV
jgi:hypothetical protein